MAVNTKRKFNIWRLITDVMCSNYLTDPNVLNQQVFNIKHSGQISCCFPLMQKFGSDLTWPPGHQTLAFESLYSCYCFHIPHILMMAWCHLVWLFSPILCALAFLFFQWVPEYSRKPWTSKRGIFFIKYSWATFSVVITMAHSWGHNT